MSFPPPDQPFSASAICCPWSIFCGRCATASPPPTIPGMPLVSSGRLLRRRQRPISTKSLSTPGKPTTTTNWTRPMMARPTSRRFPLPDSHTAVANANVSGDDHAPDSLQMRHHFAPEDQQRDAVSLGMWAFLATEVMFFGGLFCAYLIYRLWYFGDFAAASSSLNWQLGATNTAVLICSSLTVVLAVWAAQTSRRALLLISLAVTMLLGVAFLGIKGIEYKDKFEEHKVPGASFTLGRA